MISIDRFLFKASELKKVEVREASSSNLEVLLEWTENVQFCTICEITFLVGGS